MVTLILILFVLKYSAPGLARKMQVDWASFLSPYCSTNVMVTLTLILFALKYSAPGLALKNAGRQGNFFFILFNEHNVDDNIAIVCTKVFCPRPCSEKCRSTGQVFFPYYSTNIMSTLILILFALKYSAPPLQGKMCLGPGQVFLICRRNHIFSHQIFIALKYSATPPHLKNAFWSSARYVFLFPGQ